MTLSSKIFASCGHPVANVDDLIAAEFDDTEMDWGSGQLVPTVISGVYCSKCFKEGVGAGHLRRTINSPTPEQTK